MATPYIPLSPTQVNQAFLAAPPLIARSILDLSVKHPRWMKDLWELEEFPRGNGTTMEQIVFRGGRPQIERGFNGWKKLNNNSGCNPCEGPDSSYNWTNFGGHGFERKLVELMERDFRSPAYQVKEVQTTAHFEEVFAKIVENLYAQTDFFKEFNIGLNVLTLLAKKYIVDSAGPKPNPGNIYTYRNIGTKRISALNIEMLEWFYENMRKIPSCVPYDVIDGSPVFSLIASHQLIARLYRDDPQLRQDARFSGLANDLLTKYNFMSTIRGMFIAAPTLYPRRFNISTGEPIEQLPFLNDVPMDVGAYTANNLDYELATHEEVILHGKFPFKIMFLPTETTLGENSSFGPEYSFMNSWQWVNPQTIEDPARREGFFMTSATIGISQQFSEGIFSILVERPSITSTAMWLPTAPCPPTAPSCDNTVPDATCPCPAILGWYANPITSGDFFITLATPTSAVADDTIAFGLDTGGYIVGTVVHVSTDAQTVEVTFSGTPALGLCNHFTTLFCVNDLACISEVSAYKPDASNSHYIDLTLADPIRAVTATNHVTVYYGNGTTVDAQVVSVTMDATHNTWVVDTGGVFSDQVGGVVGICVPTSTDATCPGCAGVTFSQCSSDGGVTPAIR